MTIDSQRIVVERAGYWVGLPSAEELESLEKIKPGLGERAFALVERQQHHEHTARWFGMVTSFALAIGSLIGAIYFIGHGNTAGGASLAGSSTAGIVTTYLTRLLPSRRPNSSVAPTIQPTTASAKSV